MIVDLFESESIVTTHRACHTMATAPFGRVRSVASYNFLGLPDAQCWPDSRRYWKKIRTILEATRWRLRLLVGLAQSLRTTFSDCQTLSPGRTVAATGKRSARFWRPHDGDCAFWSGSLSRFARPSRTARCSGLAGQSPLPEKDPHDFGGRTMATALFGRARSVASYNFLGLPD